MVQYGIWYYIIIISPSKAVQVSFSLFFQV